MKPCLVDGLDTETIEFMTATEFPDRGYRGVAYQPATAHRHGRVAIDPDQYTFLLIDGPNIGLEIVGDKLWIEGTTYQINFAAEDSDRDRRLLDILLSHGAPTSRGRLNAPSDTRMIVAGVMGIDEMYADDLISILEEMGIVADDAREYGWVASYPQHLIGELAESLRACPQWVDRVAALQIP